MTTSGPRYLLLKLDANDEPISPPVYRTRTGETTRIDGAYSWASMEEAIDAAPGAGWQPVNVKRVVQQEKSR